MPGLRVRDFHDDDLEQVVQIWNESRLTAMEPMYGLAEVLTAARDAGLAVVAVHGGVGGRIGGRADRR